ncbi:MAG: non-hydrolyzing UDP-N-acetylglucosamine 2-epimerase [Nitrospiraceae bacterium]
MKFLSVIGARPQFIKASPLCLTLRKRHQEILVHTGQHYDYGMSDIFFKDLGIPAPDYHLGIGSGRHGVQTGAMLQAIEGVLEKERPDAVIVYGDTNSTLAGALAAAKLNIPVAHIEAGLRSFNRAMPEELNRILTDRISAWLFIPSAVARDQLIQEGITSGVHVVGDIMFDALLMHRASADRRSKVLGQLGLIHHSYYVATVHRAENTDRRERLTGIFSALAQLDKPVILPLHPRTRKALRTHGIDTGQNVRCLEPLSYLDMIQLQRHAACVLTDSGGVQKEAYYLRVPCVTLRDETEWVETVTVGWNVISGTTPIGIIEAVHKMAVCHAVHPDLYGDGTAAEQIVEILSDGIE